MSKDFIEAYKDSISRNIEFFAYEFFDETKLDFLFETEEDTVSYVDGLYLKGKVQTLYLFTDEKIRTINLLIEDGEKVIKTSSFNVVNVCGVSLEQKTHEDVKLTIEFTDGNKISLDNNNVFSSWKDRANIAIKKIHKKYY